MKVFEVQAPTPQGRASRDEQAFLLGVTFHEAALRAEAEVRDPDGAPCVALCPMAVNYAFAAELYLKSLARVGGGAPAIRGHKLHVLLGRLVPEVRTTISDVYEARTGRVGPALEADVRQFTAAFEDWRYVFEGEGRQLRTNLLIAFVKALYLTVRTHRPNWHVRLAQEQRLLADSPTPTMTIVNVGGGAFLHVIDGTGGSLNTAEA